MIIKRKSKGFTLIELILVLGFSTTAFISILNAEKVKGTREKAEIGGQQFKEVGTALSTYLSSQAGALLANVPNNTTITLPITILRGINSNGTTGTASCYPNVTSVYCGLNYLPTTFSNTNAFGSSYLLQIRNISGVLHGVVMSSTPVCQESTLPCPPGGTAANPIRYDLAGYAIRAMGAQGGMVNQNSPIGVAATLTGYNGGWTLTGAEYNTINNRGFIGYRAGSSAVSTLNFDTTYLKLDGTNFMRGNLNMGNWDINNATNITYNGWLSGFGVLANTVTAGSINATSSITAGGIIKAGSTAVTPFTGGAAAAGDIIASRNLIAQNSVVSNGDVRAQTRVQAGTTNPTPFTGVGLGNGDVVASRNVVAESTVISNNQVRAAGDIITRQNMAARDIYLGNNPEAPTFRAGRVPNAWLSDLLPRYSSRGMRFTTIPLNGVVYYPKPSCGPGTPKIEVVPQAFVGGSAVSGSTNINIQKIDANLGYSFINDFFINYSLYTNTPVILKTFDVGAGWQTWYYGYQHPSAPGPYGMSVLIHRYCDFNF